MTKGIDNI